jgi:aminoglycoside phosphotransferase family enzyme
LGDLVLGTYRADTGDQPPDALVNFYASTRAMLRAKLALWHLKDQHRPDAEKWRTRTMQYLYIAADHAAKLA